MTTSWTREEYDALRALAVEGLTAAEAMKRLNAQFGHDRTRNAIIGASHRIHVAFGRPNIGSIRSAEKRKARKRRAPRSRKPRQKLILLPPMKEGPMFEQIVIKPSRSEPPWSVADLTSRTCRWIDGDPGDPRPFACTEEKSIDKPYCAIHLRRAFGPPPRGMRAVV